jgi:ectoine hydroxylase-related dioxygenase (phytanoyl-CoA dioxygenase family)
MSQTETLRAVPRAVTDEEIAQYHENGWARLERFIEPEAAASLLAVAKEVMGNDPSGATLDQKDRDNAQRGGKVVDAVFFQNYHFIARDDRREPFASMVFSPEIGENSKRITGRDVSVRYTSDGLICKMPASSGGGSDATAWHQDGPLFPFDRWDSHAYWIALTDLTPEHGTMQFYSGSHRMGPLGRSAPAGENLPDVYPELAKKYPLTPPMPMLAGDATVHHCGVVHGAPQNTTNDPRWAYVLAYTSGDTLYNGARHHNFEGIGLEINKPLDHERFPVVCE